MPRARLITVGSAPASSKTPVLLPKPMATDEVPLVVHYPAGSLGVTKRSQTELEIVNNTEDSVTFALFVAPQSEFALVQTLSRGLAWMIGYKR